MNIQNVVVLMMENRSFDHLLGSLKTVNNKIEGLAGNESNPVDPRSAQSPIVTVTPSTQFGVPFGMGFDPAHEFPDVQMQLYGPQVAAPSKANAPTDPAPMKGFIYSANMAVKAQNDFFGDDAKQVMEYFSPDQVPVLSALAQNFAIFNWWFSSLPGPTWPNRYFVHAATAGGLNYSPELPAEVADLSGFGYKFKAGTIYDRLQAAGKNWRIYHDGLPQAATIASLYQDFISPASHFRDMINFAADVTAGSLPEYVFIEPNYDVGGNYVHGNSMHPLNDVQSGEALVKSVYETLRNSSYWEKLLLVVVFDEHGGFYDHVSPPKTVPTGDDSTYSSPQYPFDWTRLGIRVPGIVVSAYTPPGTVIDKDGNGNPYVVDHTSVLATVEKLFGLQSLTNRDKNANTLDIAMPTANPLQGAPMTLPDPRPVNPGNLLTQAQIALDNATISSNQESYLSLAHACNIAMSTPKEHAALTERFRIAKVTRKQKDAGDYIREVERKIRLRQRPGHYAVPASDQNNFKKYKYRTPPTGHPLFDKVGKAAKLKALPAKVDLRHLCLPVRNQGAEGACCGFSTAAFCEARQAALNGSLLPDYLAPAYLYVRTRLHEGTFPQNSGTSLADEFSILATYGVCPEAFIPYTGDTTTRVSPQADVAALPFRTQPIQVDCFPEVLKSVLSDKRTISIGVMVYESFEEPENNGFLKMPNPSVEKLLGGHAVLLCGYDDSTSCWIVRNQWGTNWGARGYCYMPYGYEKFWTEAWSGV